MGTLCAEFAVTLLQFWYLRKLLASIVRTIEFKELFFMLLSDTLVLWMVKYLTLSSLFWQLAISALLFFGTCGLTLLVCRESIVMSFVNKVWRK